MTKADLLKFCADIDLRPSISRPWSEGEYSYASNGHLIVRVPLLSDVSERDDAPRLEKMFDVTEPAKWFRLDDTAIPPQKVADCSKCNGEGGGMECPTCHQDIETCEDCDGTGKVEALTPVKIGERHFQAKYLHLIAPLPNCELGPRGELEPAPFRFDGGDGLLMPVRTDGRWSPV